MDMWISSSLKAESAAGPPTGERGREQHQRAADEEPFVPVPPVAHFRAAFLFLEGRFVNVRSTNLST
jgi:hypothetical protein